MRHLAACVNIFEKMESMYWWEGKLERSEETVLIAKTTPELVDKLVQTVKIFIAMIVLQLLPLSQSRVMKNSLNG